MSTNKIFKCKWWLRGFYAPWRTVSIVSPDSLALQEQAQKQLADTAQVGDYVVLQENDRVWGLWDADPCQVAGFSLAVLTAKPQQLVEGAGPAAEEAIGGVRMSQLLRRNVCFWCRVCVLQYDRLLALWKPFPNGQHSNRAVTLSQLATALPSLQLRQFVVRVGVGCKLSDAGVQFIVKHANLAHAYSA